MQPVPAAHGGLSSTRGDCRTCVPCTGSEDGCFDYHARQGSSTVEHQTENLAVTGSTPVPARKRRQRSPRGRAMRRSAAGMTPLRRDSVVECDCRPQHERGALQCADTARASSKATTNRRRFRRVGRRSRNDLGRPKSTPRIAWAQARSASRCGTDVLFRPPGLFFAN